MEQTPLKFCGTAFPCVDKVAGGESMHRLLEKRIVFIVGKGGTGKSTLTTALGMAAAKLGKRVLLVEAGDGDSLGPIFVGETLPDAPKALETNIWGARINPRTVIDEYVHTFVPSGFLAGTISRSSLFEHLAAATPGLKEVMTLGQIWRWEQSGHFDLIIVDAPATGHGLSLLRVPQTLLKMIRIGPIASQTRTVLDTLRDPAKTGIAQVTLAEELPTREALEFEAGARDQLNMAHDLIFINSIYPDVFDRDEQVLIRSLLSSSPDALPDGVSAMLAIGGQEINRRILQQAYIDKLSSRTASALVEIPFFFSGTFGLDEIKDIATLFGNLMSKAEEVANA